MILKWKLTAVIEQTGDFACQRGDNVGVKQGVQTRKEQSTDNHGD